MPRELAGKVAFVTGVARGQGRSNAVRLAQHGAMIIGVDRCEHIESVDYSLGTEEDLAETVRLIEDCGGTIHARIADVRDVEALSNAVSEGVDRFGGLDIVNANAGIISLGSVIETPIEAWRDVIDTNLMGAWLTAKVSLPHIIRGERGGSMIFTSSVAGLLGRAHAGAYVASKHGLVGLMRTLALEVAPHKIRVNTIHPTQVNTEMIMNDLIMHRFVPDEDIPTLDQFSAVSSRLHAIPVPWIETSDVSDLVAFLASDESRYITGATIPVDAGAMLL